MAAKPGRHSRVARGFVVHRRFTPRAHRFRYGLSMLLVDLDEGPRLFRKRWLWSWNRRNFAAILRRDHLRHGGADWAEAVRELVHTRSGQRPQGPISLLTQPRYAGYVMNPISVYLIWAPGRERLEWVLLEVHNTPWNQQVAYLLPVPADAHKGFTIRFGKEMHVSPFMPMDMEYEMHLRLGEERLALRLDNYRAGERVFGANLALRLHPVNAANLARTLLFTPLMTLQVVAAIHYQALRLYLKGVPYIPPPKDTREDPSGPVVGPEAQR